MSETNVGAYLMAWIFFHWKFSYKNYFQVRSFEYCSGISKEYSENNFPIIDIVRFEVILL
jgi:hypothetical protein